MSLATCDESQAAVMITKIEAQIENDILTLSQNDSYFLSLPMAEFPWA